MKSINFQTCPPTLTPNLTPPISPSKPKMVFFFPFNKKSYSHFLSHCSPKPDTDLGSSSSSRTSNEGLATNESSALESSELQQEATDSSSNQSVLSTSESSRGLVFDLGIKGSWDSVEIGSPVVKRFLSDDQERWYMWYHGRRSSNSSPDDQTDSIGIAISSNGVHWERGEKPAGSSTGLGRVMGRGEDWWAFDTKSVRPSEVIIMSSSKLKASNAVYWLYYTGFTSDQVLQFDASDEEAFVSLPGLAISQDGRHWAKIEGEDHSGALFGLGSIGEWDSLFICSPHVVFHDSRDIRMYYHSFDPNTRRFCIGMARSRDGIKWVKLGKINLGEIACGYGDELGVMNPCVVRDKKDGRYLMAYEGVGLGGGRCIGLAVSSDGLKEWRRLGDEPVLKPLVEDGWDCKGVGSPCLVQMDGSEDEKWRLYYRGIGVGGKTGIGMAVCDVAETDLRFSRWIGFRI